ncbi:MAG: menaquinone biosynthesis protein [Verrucomicrobia bacterium]|nr:menaquinone biosynthesis protein [Verrucomicrobiota bacterium]
MSTAPRIGCVPYLNAKPLIYGLEDEVVFEHPARLAQRLAAHELDTGLVPVVEVFRRPDYVIVDDISIACCGPVYSVILAHRVPLQSLREVVVDASSGTSALLLKVLLQKRFGLKLHYVTESLADKRSTADAQMLIGDQAIRFHQTRGDWQILDLGQAWSDWTHMPFVFAVWAVHADYPELPALIRKLAAARTAGCAHIEDIIAREQGGDAAFRRRYFGHNVYFKLGQHEKEAMRLFRQLLIEFGELKAPYELRFVH